MTDIEQAISDYFSEMRRIEMDMQEKELAEIFRNNNFVCGNISVKETLQKSFPNMEICYSPYISKDQIIMIKKWKVDDFLNNKEKQNDN